MCWQLLCVGQMVKATLSLKCKESSRIELMEEKQKLEPHGGECRLYHVLTRPHRLLCFLQPRSLPGSGRATTPPLACWLRSLWVWLPSRPTASWTWTGPPRSWRSRRDEFMTSQMSWRASSSSERNPRTTSSGCEYRHHRRKELGSDWCKGALLIF